MRGMIVSGGSINPDFVKSWLAGHPDFDRVIAADRGLMFCREAAIEPDVILGDFDSAASEDLMYFQERFPERIRTFPAEKDETDTELAVWAAAEAGCTDVTVFGATGTRLDHVLGNIHLLKQAADRGISMQMIDPHNRIRMLVPGKPFILSKEEQFGAYVSLIPFTGAVRGLTLRGFAYDVENFTLEAGCSRGISNQIQDETAVINFTEGILIIVEAGD